MKTVLIGLWLTAVALGAAFGATLVGSSRPGEAGVAGATLKTEKTRTINVPIVSDGAMQGYIGMQFSYVLDTEVTKTMTAEPEAYLLDTAFSSVYMDRTNDFRHLERIDMGAFTKRLVADTNAHLGAPAIKEVLIEAFNYFPKNVQNN